MNEEKIIPFLFTIFDASENPCLASVLSFLD